MALIDTLNAVTANAPATRNRVDILLDKLHLEKPDDYVTLNAALRNTEISASALTTSIRREYKDVDVVKDHSVSRWRAKNPTDVNGL
jgi:hypothetical protein